MEEQFFDCPFCFTRVSVLVDTSVKDQTYVEDCERCCNPVEIHVKCDQGRDVLSLDVEMIGH